MKKKHSEFCEGHLICPNTKKEECGKEMVHKISCNGNCEAVLIYCFGCGETHNVKEG